MRRQSTSVSYCCKQLQISDSMLDSYSERYADMERRHVAFFQLKMVLGPCIETLILLDRLAYLLEQVRLYWFLFIISEFGILTCYLESSPIAHI